MIYVTLGWKDVNLSQSYEYVVVEEFFFFTGGGPNQIGKNLGPIVWYYSWQLLQAFMC